jgi:hypothetical protein
MSSRFGIAAQGLGVAVLAALVYVAFLAPSDPDPLSGVEVDGDLPAGVAGGSDGNRGTAGRKGREGPASRGARSGPLAGIQLIPVPPGTAPPDTTAPAPPSFVVDDETPIGSQYGSAVTRVLRRVARAEP